MNDARFAVRVLRRHPAFTATVIATLALTLGANTFIATVVDRALLRPLPYRDPAALVSVLYRDPKLARNDKATGAEVTRWSTSPSVFTSVGYAWDAQYTLTSSTPANVLRAFQFSANMFATLGATATIGRTFVPRDTITGSDHVVVLSDHLWRSTFGASATVIGHVIRLDDEPYTVIGVMPPSFAHPDASIDLWTPLAMPSGLANNASLHAFNVVARLRPGLTIADARARLPGDVSLETMRDLYLGPARSVIWILQGAVLLLLLIGAANVANLVLAHASSARREVALRHALGASTGRVMRGFVTQGLLLASAGCAIGIVVADLGLSILPATVQQFGALPVDASSGVSAVAVAAAIVITVLLACVIGLLMSISTRPAPALSLRSDGRADTTTRGLAELRGAIIVMQIAVSLVLLAASSLLVRSYRNLERRSLGFETSNRLTFVLQPQANRYADLQRMSPYVDQVLAQLRALPGVQHAAATSAVPLSGMDARRRLVLPGARDSAGANVIHYRVVSPDYFATMGVALLSGRPFSVDDRAGTLEVAVVNATLARTHWPNESPIGKTVTIAGGPTPSTALIVGVVADVRHNGLAEDVEPELYRPIDQAFWPFVGIVVQTTTDATAAAKSIERAVWSVSATQPIDRVQTLDDLAADAVRLRRVSMLVISAFAIVAALLAAVGIYGVIAYLVSLRTREIGIRVALGADPATVMGRIVAGGARLALVGALIGIAATFALTRYLSTLLFGVPPRDAVSIVAAVTLTTLVALAATYVPARRASRIDPAITLRTE